MRRDGDSVDVLQSEADRAVGLYLRLLEGARGIGHPQCPTFYFFSIPE
jgi:hypothetical protein